MPGIYGLAGNAADIDALFTAMGERLRHHDWYRQDGHVDEAAGFALGRMSLGFVNTAAQPARNEDGSLLAVLDGEIYDYADQRRALEAAGHTFCGPSRAELLLRGYTSRGEEFLRGLHGKFVAA